MGIIHCHSKRPHTLSYTESQSGLSNLVVHIAFQLEIYKSEYVSQPLI